MPGLAQGQDGLLARANRERWRLFENKRPGVRQETPAQHPKVNKGCYAGMQTRQHPLLVSNISQTYGNALVKRRRFLTALTSSAVFPPLLANAQRQGKLPIVAMLADDPAVKVGLVDAFQGKLRELGWVDGSTIRFERRVPDVKAQDMSIHATELVNLAPDVLVSVGTVYTEALAVRTRQIPIVFINVSHPLQSGFSEGLAKPSRNLTGFAVFDPAMSGKMLQLLKDLKPNLRKVTGISNPDASAGQHIASVFWKDTQQFAKDLNIDLKRAEVRTAAEIDAVISGMSPGEGLLIPGDQFLYSNRRLIIDLAARQSVLQFTHGQVTSPMVVSWPIRVILSRHFAVLLVTLISC
jgi:putative tryptophan/tyrosine transport system substrate-binding protein